MFTRKGGNISIHKFDTEHTNSLARVNFAIQYHLDVIHQNGLEIERSHWFSLSNE